MFVLLYDNVNNQKTMNIILDIADILDTNLTFSRENGYKIFYFNDFLDCSQYNIANEIFDVIMDYSIVCEVMIQYKNFGSISRYNILISEYINRKTMRINFIKYDEETIKKLKSYLSQFKITYPKTKIKINRLDLIELLISNLRYIRNNLFDFSEYDKQYGIMGFINVDYFLYRIKKYRIDKELFEKNYSVALNLCTSDVIQGFIININDIIKYAAENKKIIEFVDKLTFINK